MRAASGAVIVILATCAWSVASSVTPEKGSSPSRRFEPAAFARRVSNAKQVAARFTWPTVVAFQSTHARDGGAEPIRLMWGRALWWSEPESALGTAAPASGALPELIARGSAIARATSIRDEQHDAAFSALLEKKVFDDKVHDALTARSKLRERTEGRGREWADVLWGIRRGLGHEAIVFSWVRSERWGWLDEMPQFQTDEWLRHAGRPFVHNGGAAFFVFVPTSATATTHLDGRAWEDWTYTTTLLTMREPLYEPLQRGHDGDSSVERRSRARLERVEAAMKKGTADGMAAIQTALADRTPLDDRGWGAVAGFAETNGARDLALKIRARHLPVGGCSMDTSPQEAARDYAELCFSMGKLACFLNLQVQIMGDQFTRIAYSSYGEAAHATEAGRLRDIGIDVEKFLRGLIYRFDVPKEGRRELDSWRLARSIHEANLGAAMASILRAEAARPDLDDYNRFRAADTLASLRYQQGTPGRTGIWNEPEEKRRPHLLRQIRAELESLGLPPAAKTWVESYGGHK